MAGRVVVISGGTDGMGRALALDRARRRDTVVAIGSNHDKGAALVDESGGAVQFVRADLSTVAGTRDAIRRITATHPSVDALALFANRQAPRRVLTPEGLEQTFALYYLSRYVLSHELAPYLRRSAAPVVVNVAGVGIRKGRIHWDDLQLADDYGMVAAQLQAARANDLLGVAFEDPAVRYVLYHPGFTRSGDLSPLPAAARATIRLAGRVFARPVEAAVSPINGFIDVPPSAPLTAVDRGRSVPLTLPTLDRCDAERLAVLTRALLAAR